jgi:hypothetical protein
LDEESITQVVSSLIAARCDVNMTAKYMLGNGRDIDFQPGYVSALYLALACARFDV